RNEKHFIGVRAFRIVECLLRILCADQDAFRLPILQLRASDKGRLVEAVSGEIRLLLVDDFIFLNVDKRRRQLIPCIRVCLKTGGTRDLPFLFTLANRGQGFAVLFQRQLCDILRFATKQLLLRFFLLIACFLAIEIGEIDITAKSGEHEQQNERSLEAHYLLRRTQTMMPVIKTDAGNTSTTRKPTVRPLVSVM